MEHPSVDLVYINAGGGHRAAAQALQQQLAVDHPHWNVRLLDLSDMLDPQRTLERAIGFSPEDYYNLRLRRGWTIGLRNELRLLQKLIRAGHGVLRRRMQQHWLRTEPDLVVSLLPNFNRAMGDALAQSLPGVPFVTVMTDLADVPPDFWIEPGVQQHIVCGCDHAVAQALAAGVPHDRVHPVSGMLLRPSFYAAPDARRAPTCASLGLDEGRPTAVVCHGGHGSTQMLRIAKLLPDLQLILLCGRNEALAERLRALDARTRRLGHAPRAVLGFTQDMAGMMRLADFCIGKPGPGVLSEALHLGLPVITFRNAWTMPQERYNARWVQQHGWGLALKTLAELPAACAEMTRHLPAFRTQLKHHRNRAVFEVSDLLAERLDASRRPAPAAQAWWPAQGALLNHPSDAEAGRTLRSLR